MNLKEYNTAVDHYTDDLYRFAFRYTNERQSAWDAVQDCFLALWEHHTEVEPSDAKRYMIKVLYHKLIDQHRTAQKFSSQPTANLNDGYRPQDSFELHDALQAALNQLPDIQRKLLLLKDLEGYSYKEIAALTQLSDQQVMVYLYRARIKMKQLLAQ